MKRNFGLLGLAVVILVGALAWYHYPVAPNTPVVDEIHLEKPATPDAHTHPPEAPRSTVESTDAKPSTRWTPELLRDVIKNFETELPSVEALRAHDPHRIHPDLIKAYSRVGLIGKAGSLSPEMQAIAFEALLECINLRGYDPSLRSLCLLKHREIRKKAAISSFDEENRFDDLESLNRLLKRSNLSAD